MWSRSWSARAGWSASSRVRGDEAAFSDQAYTEAGGATAPDGPSQRGRGRPGRAGQCARAPSRSPRCPEGVTTLSFFGVAQSAGRPAGPGRQEGDGLQLRPAAPDQPGPGHGCPELAGHRVGLPGRARAAEHLAKFFPMFMTAAGTVPAGQGARHGCRRGRTAVHRHGAAPRGGGQGLRRARRGQGGGREPRAPRSSTSGSRPRAPAATPASSAPKSSSASAPPWPRRSAAPTSSSPPRPCPGRKAPVLVTASHGRGHGQRGGRRRHGGRPGRQLRADQGRRGGRSQRGVHVVGMANPPSGMPTHASFLYARNVANVLGLDGPRGHAGPRLGRRDRRPACACCARANRWRRPRWSCSAARTEDRRSDRQSCTRAPDAGRRRSSTGIVAYLTVFVLAAFVGIEVVSKVPSILHTPLMSGSNAIHGIVLVGALTIMGEAHGAAELVLGFLAVFLATLNIVGRLRGDRPHARDVQAPSPPSAARAPGRRRPRRDSASEARRGSVRTPRGAPPDAGRHPHA